MSSPKTHDAIEGVAIVGMSGRFPGAKNLDAFWQNLREGKESITFLSDQELESSLLDLALPDNPDYVKAASVLEDIEWFDASFFGISPREAALIDPQQRILLECAWEALENAGYDTEKYKGWIGVFAGAASNTYLLNNLYLNYDLLSSLGSLQLATTNERDYLTTRVSYKLNLKGPSVNVQTACSTSLVAVCLACESLLTYQCDMALAGAVAIRVPQRTGYLYQEGGILSPDGHCRAFDAKARGTVFGSGVGLVVLKRLSDALADGDYIHAIIRGFAVNNDGALKVSYTAPSVPGQAEVIAMAHDVAGINAETISYVEAHGTGTALGDPIEIAALTKAFRARTQRKGFCAVGSVKTNVGHLDAAAGMAGLIKTVLALKHKLLPPSLHFEQPNPRIDFSNSPFYVNTALSEWRADTTPRRAGVSSFGFGGSNAHVILEEAPAVPATDASRPWQLLLLSAKTSSALETLTASLVEHLTQHPELALADVAYTLQVGRKDFSHRRMLLCRDRVDAVDAFQTRNAERVRTAFQEPRDRPIVFMFPGQGAQHANMALELYQTEPTFREQVDLCCEALKSHLGFDLRDRLYPGQRPTDAGTSQLDQTLTTQPALFVIEYALAKLWMSWGVRPQAMIGHSLGEYVAACLADVVSLEDALALVAGRARLMQRLPRGAMLAVPLPEKELHDLLGPRLSLAAVNGRSLCLASGPIDAVEELECRLAAKGVHGRRLHTSHAFHSAMMEPIIGPFIEQVRERKPRPPRAPYISNVTGTWITGAEATDPGYWARHLRQTVRFADGLRELLKEPDRILLEVGPGQTLSALAKQHLNTDTSAEQMVLPSLPHPHDGCSDTASLLNALGRLWLAGAPIDWSGFYAHDRRRRVPLPTYPFERQRYWIELPTQVRVGHGIEPDHLPSGEHPRNAETWSPHLRPDLQVNYIAPRNATEQMLTSIWQAVLGVDRVGVYDNFFDLGGASIQGLQVIAKASEAGMQITPELLFKHQTIADLAAAVGTTRAIEADPSPLTDPLHSTRR